MYVLLTRLTLTFIKIEIWLGIIWSDICFIFIVSIFITIIYLRLDSRLVVSALIDVRDVVPCTW